jgi:hypothetical protein
MLVQFFLIELLKKPRPRRISAPPPRLTGVFDLSTGFWIYEAQFVMGRQATIDGVVSPARGNSISYGQGNFWLIGSLNFGYYEGFPGRYESLPEDGRLSPGLRAAISPGA